jgi:hypothetical protein
MPKSTVLDRVAADLAHGHTAPAIARLSSLVHAHPADLDLRRQLAAVHRRVGNPVEAGRWGYLDADAPAVEVGAFERAYPDPAHRLRRLGWSGSAVDAPTGYAREQLTRLGTAARPTPRHRTARIGLLVAGAVFLALVLVGAVTVVQWLVS